MNQESGQIPMNEPLAYFLTWTTYGSWLPGDDRGWSEKPGIFRSPSPGIRRAAEQCLTEPILTLDLEQRQIVEETIRAHCIIRKWQLHAVNARTQHVHVVLTAPGRDPEDVLDQLKAWCTRKLKAQERRTASEASQIRQNWWTQRGSKRRLNNQGSLENAIRYVLEDQGDTESRALG
jgi:REP element-mobilizing transposase RayT